jgi:hypothetical protein
VAWSGSTLAHKAGSIPQKCFDSKNRLKSRQKGLDGGDKAERGESGAAHDTTPAMRQRLLAVFRRSRSC